MKNIKGYVHSVETAGTVDGPGIRYIVFTSGCPLRCLYCHNPDTRKMKMGKHRDSFEILKEIYDYKDYHQKTGGGVTISGGEPLIQPEFISSIFEGCKKICIHTALDTSGFQHTNLKDEDFKNIDLVLLDIKSMIPELYKKITNVDLEPTLEFAKRLDKLKVTTWIRFVLVPELTDSKENLEKLADLVKTLSNVELVEILPFHKMGERKWKEMGYDYELLDACRPTEAEINSAKQIFSDRGIKVR
ncbi:MAG: pyruvate formate lyase-activating protein [Proteobacteria bacterium]|nr:pyruvate formate lyase-activating protein [Pseudomonadota bacterium]